MRSLRFRLMSLVAGAALSLTLLGLNTAAASADVSAHTCHSGSIAAGTYSRLVVAGVCSVDKGSVVVRGDLVVRRGAGLLAATGGSNLRVQGDLLVRTRAVLVLGCEPFAFTCLNDSQTNPTMSTNDRVGEMLDAQGALALIVHHAVLGTVVQSDGGGGVNCSPRSVLFGSPAYFTYEDNTIRGNATIDEWRSCWAGFIRNNVSGTVRYMNNVTADPDGNEIVTNTISGSLLCAHNSPRPQIGDSGGALNVVSGRVSRQCRSLV